MSSEMWPLISASLFVGLTVAFGPIVEAQDDADMSGDSHFQEELGINRFTTPSIEQLFDTLDSLKPIPVQELTRPPQALRLDNRVKFALSFGVLIGDGFLAVEGEQIKAIEPLGRELLRRAKGLGVQQRVSRHSKQILDLAKRLDWSGLRKELIVTQQDVEKAMLDLRDEEMVHLLSLGGWIRGLEIGAASVAADFSPERASQLRHLDLLDYYLQRLDTLSTPLKSTPLISQIISGLKEVRQKLAGNAAISQEDVSGIQMTARSLVALIEGSPSTASAVGSN
ncbi:MAG: hypothetical protein QOI53_325 [Verrucomicrobiota bacterium]|jgi:hypothetical protein|nr:hypothetical protein [Verrucomicrobiota bacterium]